MCRRSTRRRPSLTIRSCQCLHGDGQNNLPMTASVCSSGCKIWLIAGKKSVYVTRKSGGAYGIRRAIVPPTTQARPARRLSCSVRSSQTPSVLLRYASRAAPLFCSLALGSAKAPQRWPAPPTQHGDTRYFGKSRIPVERSAAANVLVIPSVACASISNMEA